MTEQEDQKTEFGYQHLIIDQLTIKCQLKL